MCMQFTLDKIPSKIVLFTTSHFFLLFHVEKLQSAGPGARQSTTRLTLPQSVDQIRTLYHWLLKPCMLAVSALHYICPPPCFCSFLVPELFPHLL